jgi:hypothetical protein
MEYPSSKSRIIVINLSNESICVIFLAHLLVYDPVHFRCLAGLSNLLSNGSGMEATSVVKVLGSSKSCHPSILLLLDQKHSFLQTLKSFFLLQKVFIVLWKKFVEMHAKTLSRMIWIEDRESVSCTTHVQLQQIFPAKNLLFH